MVSEFNMAARKQTFIIIMVFSNILNIGPFSYVELIAGWCLRKISARVVQNGGFNMDFIIQYGRQKTNLYHNYGIFPYFEYRTLFIRRIDCKMVPSQMDGWIIQFYVLFGLNNGHIRCSCLNDYSWYFIWLHTDEHFCHTLKDLIMTIIVMNCYLTAVQKYEYADISFSNALWRKC